MSTIPTQSEPIPKSKLYRNLTKSKSDSMNYLLKILPNGLKALLISDPDAHKSSAAIAVNIGYLSDPVSSPGLAHFCEHMLFLGTEKYPKEDEYHSFVAKNGGNSNAYTSSDVTCYYFDVSNEAFDQALDRFAQFFIKPLFNKESVDKEIRAIDSENKKNLNNDLWRLLQLRRSESKKKSMFTKFSTGNIEVLNKPTIRDELLEMYNKFYSSDIMNLCVLSNKPLDTMEEYVTSLFSQVPKKENLVLPRYNEVLPYDETNLGFFYKVEPIKNLDSLKIFWYLPEDSNFYQSKPLTYLCDLLGHEGPNSLASSLFKDDLITSLVTDKSCTASAFSTLSVNIGLTKKGLGVYKEIIKRVFKYLSVLKKEKINRRYWEEFKKILQLGFDFKSKSDPINSTKKLCINLLRFKEEDVLSGQYICGDFNEELISKYLNLLSPENCNIFLQSPSIKEECTYIEQWYKTKFTKEKFSLSQEEIENCECSHPLGYPPENTFIPSSLDLLPVPNEIQKYPNKIFSSKRCNLWYKQDTTYKLPKAYVRCKISLAKNTCGNNRIMNDALCSVMNSIVKNELRETSYMATQASVDFSLSMGYNSIILQSYGFNKSMHNVIKTLLTEFKKITFDDKEKIFSLLLEKLKQDSANYYLSNGYIVCVTYTDLIMQTPSFTNLERLKFLMKNKITIDDLVKYAKECIDNAKFEWVIEGNLSKEEAIDIVSVCNELFNIDTANEKETDIEIMRSINIQSKTNFIYTFDHPNPKEINSSICSFYQCGHLDDKERMILEVLQQFLKTKFFDELRTKQGIGYVVVQSLREYKTNMGIAFLVQSNTKEPEYISQKIREFVRESLKKVSEISEEEFKVNVNGVLVEQKKKDINLCQETTRHYLEIVRHQYRFDIKEKNCVILENLKKEELVEFYKKHFIEDVRKIDVEYVAECHKENNEKLLKEAKEENGIKRVRVDTIAEFAMMNELFPDFFNMQE